GLSERSDLVEKIWLPISYMYMAVSGFFYLAVWLPPAVRGWALLQPSLQSYELLRAGLFGNTVRTYGDPVYLSLVCAVLTPIGLTGGFQGSLTGNDNMRFIARIYNKPFDEIKAYVDDFAELGKYLSEPVKIYSIGMRARFAFALSLAIDFDCYLIDEVIAVGDQRFQRRSHEELFEKRADRSLILASHIGEVVRSYCTSALILHRGRGKVFSDLDLGLQIYNDL